MSGSRWHVWTSPNGVDHLVRLTPYGHLCSTCGRLHYRGELLNGELKQTLNDTTETEGQG